MLLFEQLLKARKKSMYAIGKHPNSHRRTKKAEPVKDIEPTGEERLALYDYQSSTYYAVNLALRMGRGNVDLSLRTQGAFKRMPDVLKKMIARTATNMKSLIDKKAKPLEEDTVVYRSVGDASALFAPATAMNVARDEHMAARRRAEMDIDGHLAKMKGRSFVDHGVVSTTTSEGQAISWGNRGGSLPVLFRISVPKGTKVFNPEEMHDQKDVIVKKERMLMPGTRFRVKKIGVHAKDSNIRLVDLEVVP